MPRAAGSGLRATTGRAALSAVREILGDDAVAATRTRFAARDHVRDQVLSLANGRGRIVAHGEKAWASITFSGTRHRLTIDFEGAEEVEGGEDPATFLPEHEFTIPGQLVADAGVVEAEHRLDPEPAMTVKIELLLLEQD